MRWLIALLLLISVDGHSQHNWNNSDKKVEASLVDENGDAYGVKHIGNKPRVSAMPYAYDIAEGNVSGHASFRALGYNAGVETPLEDITEYGGTIIQIATATAMQIDGANAADAGVAIYSEVSTGGSSTTLVDTDEDFTAGDIVVAGDCVINDTQNDVGTVTSVAVTTLTFSGGYKGGATGASGDSYRILDKSAGGNNIQLIEVNGLDGNYDEQSEFVITNGAGTTNLSNSYLRVNSFHAMFVGVAGNTAADDILLEDQATGAVTYNQITAGGNMSLQAYYTVPNGKVMFITDWQAGATGSKAVKVLLRATVDYNDRGLLPDLFLFQDVVSVQNSTNQTTFSAPIRVPAKADVKVSATGEAESEVATSFGFWIEDE